MILVPLPEVDSVAQCPGCHFPILQLDWQGLVSHDQAIASTLDNLDPDEVMKEAGLQECVFRPIIPAAEPWPMPATALKLLQQCFAVAATDSETLRSLKLELPALRSDHGTDCRALKRHVETLRKSCLPDHRLPLHPVDVESGEGLEFPRRMLQKDADRIRAIERERLEVGKDVMVYVVRSLKAEWTDEGRQELFERIGTYQGVGAREHLTPPLSPMREVVTERPFAPESDTCEVPVPSEPSSRLGEDIEAAESRVLAADRQFWADAMDKDQSPERYDDMDISEMIREGDFRSVIEMPSPPPLPRNLKLDSPLLPASDEGSGMEVVRVLAPEDLAKAKELVMNSDTSSGSDGPTGQLVALFKASETAVMRQAEQEKLQPLDATARATVPILDFSIPVPEWEQRIWDAEAMFRWIQKDMDVDWQGSKWAHNRAAEQKMVWAPLAHMGEKKLVSEKIEVQAALLESFLRRPRDDEVLTSADYIYKEPGPAILRMDDDDDDEDYITEPLLDEPWSSSPRTESSEQPAGSTGSSSQELRSSPHHRSKPRIPKPADLTALVAGRKRQIDEMVEKRQVTKRQTGGSAPSCDIHPEGLIDASLIPSTNVFRGYMNEFTDFAPLVENFVEMNFPKKPKLTHSSYFAPSGNTGPSPALSKAEMAAKLMPPPPKPVLALAPAIMLPEAPPRIVVSTAVSNTIIQHLKKLLPAMVLIARDYDKHRPPGWQPGTSPPNLDEADMIVSPSTGLLLTTMVHLRQRALPQRAAAAAAASTASREGHGTRSDAHPTFHRIVRNVAARHERLVVLVSEGNKHSETASPLSQSDARALAELQGFAARLRLTAKTDVQVVRRWRDGGG
ncbi:hypothetical protein VTJ49DRAFT_3196 [Mycothermus thermophilus]|uniref:DUF7102 domain-containing protein n=1 Tax=Humicola insolens TaxID=85995 RepID=A0ABR3VQ37_HUMIN